ncbi:UNVERIFIED_CONTAM: hypothetical protein FKN15_068241 [Acipenser sinensis]
MPTSEFLDNRVVDCGDLQVTLKTRDPRLLKNLTLGEFILAFAIYRDVLFSVYPNRREERDSYEFYIVELSVSYGGTIFFNYHKSFSAKAAAILASDNRIIDWLQPDLEPFNMIFSGFRVNTCGVCSSTGHSTSLCPKLPSHQPPPYQQSASLLPVSPTESRSPTPSTLQPHLSNPQGKTNSGEESDMQEEGKSAIISSPIYAHSGSAKKHSYVQFLQGRPF